MCRLRRCAVQGCEAEWCGEDVGNSIPGTVHAYRGGGLCVSCAAEGRKEGIERCDGGFWGSLVTIEGCVGATNGIGVCLVVC